MNDEIQDLKLNTSQSPEPAKPDSKRPIWPILLIAVVLVGVLIFWLRSGDDPAPTSDPVEKAATETAPEVETPGEAELVIGEAPPIVESDPWIRSIVEQLSSHPELARWLLNEELVRTFVVVVDNIAEGTPPSSHLDFLAPEEGFQVQESGDKTVIDPASYGRYDGMIDVIESVDAAGAGELYRAAHPLFQEAYEDLGYPGQSFDIALGEPYRDFWQFQWSRARSSLTPRLRRTSTTMRISNS